MSVVCSDYRRGEGAADVGRGFQPRWTDDESSLHEMEVAQKWWGDNGEGVKRT